MYISVYLHAYDVNEQAIVSFHVIRITCLSHYFPESVCTAVYGVGYSLSLYYLLLVRSLQLSDATLFPRKFRRHVGKIVAIRLALQRRDILGNFVARSEIVSRRHNFLESTVAPIMRRDSIS